MVLLRAAIDRHLARLGIRTVICAMITAIKVIPATAAAQDIALRSSLQLVASLAAVAAIISRAAENLVIAPTTAYHVVSFSGYDHVTAT